MILTKIELADVVYEVFTPQSPGKVIECLPGDRVKVRWLRPKKTGKETIQSTLHLKKLADLINDHHKKLATHENNYGEAECL